MFDRVSMSVTWDFVSMPHLTWGLEDEKWDEAIKRDGEFKKLEKSCRGGTLLERH